MKKNVFNYSVTKHYVRIICAIAALILLIATIHTILTEDICYIYHSKSFWILINTIQNSISFVLFILVIIFPVKIEILAIVCFLYSVTCTVFEPSNPMGTLMYILFLAILHCRGYFLRRKFIKYLLSSLAYLLLTITELRFGVSNFTSAIINKVGYDFTEACIIISIILYYNTLYEKKKDSILNIAKYEKLTQRDCTWLIMIQQNKSYKVISKKYEMTEGSVRNRINQIYETIGVKDKQDFLLKYLNYKITFENTPTNLDNPVISN